MYKYRINEFFDTLKKEDRDILLNCLPAILGITKVTLLNYMKIEQDSPQDIPHTIVKKLETIIGRKKFRLSTEIYIMDNYKTIIEKFKNENNNYKR